MRPEGSTRGGVEERIWHMLAITRDRTVGTLKEVAKVLPGTAIDRTVLAVGDGDIGTVRTSAGL